MLAGSSSLTRLPRSADGGPVGPAARRGVRPDTSAAHAWQRDGAFLVAEDWRGGRRIAAAPPWIARDLQDYLRIRTSCVCGFEYGVLKYVATRGSLRRQMVSPREMSDS
jgi:hypothetical protein